MTKPLTFSIQLAGDKPYQLEIVGESHYKKNLLKICGKYDRDLGYSNDRHIAELILEDSNPHDNNAVLVRIDDLPVGHLKRDHALAYRQRMAALGLPGSATGYCRASITGGFKRPGDADIADFGVTLDFSPYNFTLQTSPAASPKPVAPKQPGKLIKPILAMAAICVTCFCLLMLAAALSNLMQSAGLLPTSTPYVDAIPQPTIPATLTPSPSPTVDPLNAYLAQYGGNRDVYARIAALTDCKQLQDEFDQASANNAAAAAGSDKSRWSLGYMMIADARLKQLGCY